MEESIESFCWVAIPSTSPEYHILREPILASDELAGMEHPSLDKNPARRARQRLLHLGYSGAPFLLKDFQYGEQVIDPKKSCLPVMPIVGQIWAVSELFRRVVEGLEPNVHEFLPMKMLDVDGTQATEQYYLFNVCRRLAAVNLDESELVWLNDAGGNPRALRPRVGDRLVIHAGVVTGHQIWRDDYFNRDIFMTSEMKGAITCAGIPNLEFLRVLAR